jgi:hypothetical protein
LGHLTVVLPNAGRGAPAPPYSSTGVHRPCPATPKLGLVDASNLIVCINNFFNFF